MNKDLKKILTITKMLSGSIMDIDDIYNQYVRLTPAKKYYLYKESRTNIRDLDRLLGAYEEDKDHAFNSNFESRLGLLSVGINLIALDNDTKDIRLDPATVLLCGLDNKNKKIRY